jgi:two-component system chemotaxis response regulator CheY
MRVMVRNILKNNGYEDCTLIEVSNGIEAIGKYIEHKPHLVFMNIVMPDIDAITAIKKIKAIDPDARIIMLSSANLALTTADSFIAGAVDYIIKPFSADKLIDVANKHLAEYVQLDIAEIEAWKFEVQNSIDGDTKRIDQYLIDELIDKFTT